MGTSVLIDWDGLRTLSVGRLTAYDSRTMAGNPVPLEEPRQDRPVAEGLLRSLSELSFRSSLFAIGLPVAIALGFRLTGHSVTNGSSNGGLPFAVLSVAIGSFVLIPMLALTGAATAAMVAGHVLWFGRGNGWRALFLVCLGAWAMVTAYAYDTVVIPSIT